METQDSAKRENLYIKLLEIRFQKCTKCMPSIQAFREEVHCSVFLSLCFIVNFLNICGTFFHYT